MVEKREPRTLNCDVAVYGGTPAGGAAAVQAARLGKSVILILGQSAGTAAALAIDDDQAVQDVPYAKLEELLVEQGQRL